MWPLSEEAKCLVSAATRYAKERKQFGTPIANFGAIKHKIAEVSTRIFARNLLTIGHLRTLKMRIMHLWPRAWTRTGTIEVPEEFGDRVRDSERCTDLKSLDFAVDEGVQALWRHGILLLKVLWTALTAMHASTGF